ncbi:ATPase family associated with various cellular activities (AAA) [Carpediemonas membranifera]|uniref:ATPase family associated with various cellular activities (AAA) n=1 Tax=Carpediemonas membranifera TaxID=201153 RepID=A0A8J6AYY8_9EUKA|nr:ATPase family associated with various cellular activities (AAA) [Carpediemonas membranifera]|eukprot:KAG9390679.1 ATPase family associated with various cellular activities (AAA) [Carpediemonas membranifera]
MSNSDDDLALLNLRESVQLLQHAYKIRIEGNDEESAALLLAQAQQRIMDATVFENDKGITSHLMQLSSLLESAVISSRDAALPPAPPKQLEGPSPPKPSDPSIKSSFTITPVDPKVQWDHLVGLEALKARILEHFILPARHPDLFTGPLRQGARSALLYGPPGTGKTSLVHAVASEAGRTVIPVSAGTILSRWSGEAEQRVDAIFSQATDESIIFLDELDGLGQTRGTDDPGSRRLLSQLLMRIPEVPEGVWVWGATNRIEDIDPALIRRFDLTVEVGLPDATQVASLMRNLLADVDTDVSDVTVVKCANRMSAAGANVSDVKRVCREAALRPVRAILHELKTEAVAEVLPVMDSHVEEAVDEWAAGRET